MGVKCFDNIGDVICRKDVCCLECGVFTKRLNYAKWFDFKNLRVQLISLGRDNVSDFGH